MSGGHGSSGNRQLAIWLQLAIWRFTSRLQRGSSPRVPLDIVHVLSSMPVRELSQDSALRGLNSADDLLLLLPDLVGDFQTRNARQSLVRFSCCRRRINHISLPTSRE